MQLTSAQKVLVAAALVERHELPIGVALDMADTAAGALEVADPDAVLSAALAN